MANTKQAKTFDAIDMKRAIQEQVFVETRGLNSEELIRHMRKSIKESRFASFLESDAPATAVENN